MLLIDGMGCQNSINAQVLSVTRNPAAKLTSTIPGIPLSRNAIKDMLNASRIAHAQANFHCKSNKINCEQISIGERRRARTRFPHCNGQSQPSWKVKANSGKTYFCTLAKGSHRLISTTSLCL